MIESEMQMRTVRRQGILFLLTDRGILSILLRRFLNSSFR